LSWDLTAILNAADPKAALPDRNLWLTRLLEWLRHSPLHGDELDATVRPQGTRPLPVVRLTHLLNVLERHPEHASSFAAVLAGVWRDCDAVGLFADVGFASRMALWSEVSHRLRLRLLPGTVDTRELGELFGMLFPAADDEQWLKAIDEPLLARLAALFTGALPVAEWRTAMLDALTILVSAVRAAGLSGPLRQRMGSELLANQPFGQLAAATDAVVAALSQGDDAALRPALQYLRALLQACRSAAASVPEHLEAWGVSVDIMFEVDQLTERTCRIEDLLDVLVSEQPARDLLELIASLVRVVHERRSLRTLFARHYALLSRKVAERSAETGEHYITRNAAEYRQMLGRAMGGGAVIGGTTLAKFALAALTLPAFWAGFAAGANYALSFVLIHLLHWTVATKQPAMTAPAMAHKMREISSAEGLDGFVDEVAHLLRSQIAGIAGNLLAVVPVVLMVQGLGLALTGSTPVGLHDAEHVLHSLQLLGPSLFFAAFTGVLLFASSLMAGWVENWFVFYRIDSAIAWNPRLIVRLGAVRAQRWSHWWRANISGLAANISLGLMLGLVPVLLAFVGLPIEVRHVTLSAGQLAAAIGAIGVDIFRRADFWACVAGIPLIGILNLGVSFALAFAVALRARGVKLADRGRLSSAIWRRLRTQPRSFLLPPRE